MYVIFTLQMGRSFYEESLAGNTGVRSADIVLVIGKEHRSERQPARLHWRPRHSSPLAGGAIKSGFSTPSKIRLAGAQFGLNKTFLFTKTNPDKEPLYVRSAVCLQNTI